MEHKVKHTANLNLDITISKSTPQSFCLTFMPHSSSNSSSLVVYCSILPEFLRTGRCTLKLPDLIAFASKLHLRMVALIGNKNKIARLMKKEFQERVYSQNF